MGSQQRWAADVLIQSRRRSEHGSEVGCRNRGQVWDWVLGAAATTLADAGSSRASRLCQAAHTACRSRRWRPPPAHVASCRPPGLLSRRPVPAPASDPSSARGIQPSRGADLIVEVGGQCVRHRLLCEPLADFLNALAVSFCSSRPYVPDTCRAAFPLASPDAQHRCCVAADDKPASNFSCRCKLRAEPVVDAPAAEI